MYLDVGFTCHKPSPSSPPTPGPRASLRLLAPQSKSVSYDELVIATGSKPWLPPVPGLGLEALIFMGRLRRT